MDNENEIVAVGCNVVIVLRDRAGNEERLSVSIVADDAADYAHGLLGQGTPLARVLIGERVGSVIPYLKDDIYSIEIVSVSKSVIEDPKDAANKRHEAWKKAIRDVEDTNAIVFASSFSGKWGDYDPDSIRKDKKPGETEKPGE